MKKKAVILRGCAGITALLTMISTSATTLAFPYSGVINSYLNITTSKVIQTDDADASEAVVYDNEFGTDSSNNQEAMLLELAVASENIAQAEEGTVLLTNHDNALPLAADTSITLFGNGSYNTVGASSASPFDAIVPSTITSAFQDALGADNVNTTLGDNVYSQLRSTSNTEVAEAPIADVKAYEDTWKNNYNDAAVVVLSRAGGEGNDSTMITAENRHYLGLSKNEEDLMQYLKQQKESGVFGKIIVLINSEQAMELGWLDDYDVDACVMIGRPGTVGATGVVNVLTGAANPSGRVVDTYAVNSLSASATTYAADNTQTWSNVDYLAANDGDYVEDGGVENYIIYAEGIYTGYKYYETRYEDTVLGNGSADSSVGSSTGNAWNYNDEVAFTFGDGLSYTTFEKTLDEVKYDADSDSYKMTVTVKNTGDVAGMDVVEAYAQTPYGDYEKENSVEKAAIQFVGMAKTGVIEPGASETVTVDVDRYFLASYDSKGAEGYILSAGDYYLAIGDSSHDALNNVLAAKGYSTADGMDSDGNAELTYSWNQEALDTDSYRYSKATGEEVTNQFDFADLSHYGIEFTYLSRNDWEGTYPAEPVSLAVTDEMVDDMVADWYTEDEYSTGDTYDTGKDNGLTFADLHYAEYDDDDTWNSFLDQLTIEEMVSMISDNDGYDAIDSVGLPALKRTDDNGGIGTLTCNGQSCLKWISEVTTARTWNTERFSERGRLLGIEAVFCDVDEIWYGGGNIHRTAFGGRNNQYYSEDGNYGYIVGAYEAEAMQNVGVIFCIKHFALNDQETSRTGISVFTNEQALREIYLRAFEGAFTEGGALSVMTAFNRIGVTQNNADEALVQKVLRGEWGFKGHITSDGYSSTAYLNHFAEFLVTGQDYFCLDAGSYASGIQNLINAGDTGIISYLRTASKNNLYVLSRSIAVNGLTSGTVIQTIVPGWKIALFTANIVFGVAFLGCTIASIGVYAAGKKKKAGGEA